jgi:hypothetical protein
VGPDLTDETNQWISPMLEAMTRHEGRSLGHLLEATVTDGKLDRVGELDWVEFGRAMRVELGWDDYPAHPAPTC